MICDFQYFSRIIIYSKEKQIQQIYNAQRRIYTECMIKSRSNINSKQKDFNLLFYILILILCYEHVHILNLIVFAWNYYFAINKHFLFLSLVEIEIKPFSVEVFFVIFRGEKKQKTQTIELSKQLNFHSNLSKEKSPCNTNSMVKTVFILCLVNMFSRA